MTHWNEEAACGAMAVALATAIATRMQTQALQLTAHEFIQTIVDELPATDTKAKINKSLSVPANYSMETVRNILGNGSKMLAQDTVPFVIWCAAQHLHDYEAALWKAVSILGDRDTICAMVGGITIMSAEPATVPQDWLKQVEKVEESVFW